MSELKKLQAYINDLSRLRLQDDILEKKTIWLRSCSERSAFHAAVISNSIRDMIVNYFHDHSPVEPTVDNNWHITGVDLSKDDPRRAEIIGYINDGLLPTPLRKSYNLADYGELAAEAEANRP